MNPADVRLLAEKIGRELYRIAQAYGKEHPYRFEDLVHDLAVMIQHDSLTQIWLRFLRPGADRQILAEYGYTLHAGDRRFHLDDAQGLGIVPLTPPFDMNLVLQRDPRSGAYENQLRLSWGNAPQFRRSQGFEHQDGNTSARTGGRASKQVYMDDALRRRGLVKFYLPAKLYGFIVAQDGVDVFFHANNTLAGFQPHAGQRVTFLPLITPRGVQAKDVRPE